MNPLIQVSGVWFDYQPEESPQENWALKEINLSIQAGEYISIIGPNGSGKSTLARLLNGLLLPVKGNVIIGGKKTTNEQDLWQIRRQVGMVFQNPDNQIVATTVQDDVAFGLENLGVPREEMTGRIRLALEATGLSEMEEREPHHLSGGQKQRLAIAGIIAMQPEAIVFDEATSMLDPQGREDVLQIIRELHQQGTTVIHITHSAREAFLAERIVVMAAGQIQLDLPSGELYPQSMLLKKWGLEVPLPVELHHRLLQHGWPLQREITSLEDLVNELWRFLSKD
ncbi:energy-coupling factor transporter ATPase [Paenactinomyces guangxiensis]|uniref:Energy-coupling factor transporter ATPase n=1 Tax=Paenactinomyces guangxiensis TaxID=1490290 RepID=A0A7W2AAI4_9BACL|nr:energy-coupling factor transporter ATPase [Paenactinomyces guangxiensis]MBA4495918.1 energy-coupling factor transporter ATPase [Paenactinomyces guangxiensis]MBH8592945.1 energy-coupling factor transporter ATPase [Paenactinomyces guangxiensis]